MPTSIVLSDRMTFLATAGRHPTWGAALADGRGEWSVFAAVLAVVGAGLLLRYGRRRLSNEPAILVVLWYINRFWTVFWYRLRRVGRCTVPAEGPVILTANHGSTADPLMLYATCPHRLMGFMIAREYAHLPLLHHFTDVVGCIPVKRDGQDSAATRAAIRRLREGRMLGIFIEGRIPRPGETEPPKHGVALLALRSGATVVPAHISGQIYRDGVAASFFARHRARVRYGPPVDLSDFTGRDRETLSRATEKILAAILELQTRA